MSSPMRRALRVAAVIFVCHAAIVLPVELLYSLLRPSPRLNILSFRLETTLERPVFELVHQDLIVWLRPVILWLTQDVGLSWVFVVDLLVITGFVVFGGLLYSIPAFFIALGVSYWRARRCRRSAPEPAADAGPPPPGEPPDNG